MNIKMDEKFRFVHMKLGIKQDYARLIKENNFTESEQNILFQASIDVNSPEPKSEFIYKAYSILHPKKVQNTSQKNKSAKNTKLMICPDCQKNISKNANLCPHCGLSLDIKKNEEIVMCNKCNSKVYKSDKVCPNCQYDLKAQKKLGEYMLIAIVIIVLLSTLTDTNKVEEERQTSITKQEKVKKSVVVNSPWDGSVHQVERYLKSTLSDPNSYESIMWTPVNERSDGTFTVRHKYRARNGFGGMNIESKLFILNSNGNVISAK